MRILSHFVPLFVAGNAPKIVVEDEEATDLETVFAENIVEERTEPVTLTLDGEHVKLEIWSLKCKKAVRMDTGGNNFAFLTAHNRSVLEYCLDEQLGLKSLDGEFVYVGGVSGDWLDSNVNAERTAFICEGSDIEQIKRSIARHARTFLEAYIEQVLQAKTATTKEVIAENPQFLFVEPDVKEFVKGLQPNATKKEDIFVELSRNRFRRQRTFTTLKKEISRAEVIDEAIEEKIAEYKKHVTHETKGALAEYVMRRKSVLDLMEKFLGHTDDPEKPRYNKEEALHRLICPMRVDSNKLAIEDHNLWLLDDRLAFFHYFASDLEMNKFAAVEGEERPDLAFFYDSCVAWRETENSDAVIIVEFKRPMREDYSKGKDPVQQVLHYVKRLQTEKSVPDKSGRAIRGINAGTAFQCYVVCDLTEELRSRVIGRFFDTPDGQGLFGYSANPSAYVEIVPYGKILNDARLRNAIFFKTLGITEATG